MGGPQFMSTLRGDQIDLMTWQDTGCDVSPSCLACPLTHCKYDNYTGMSEARRRQSEEFHALIVELRDAGLSWDAIQQQLGCGRATISRALKGRR